MDMWLGGDFVPFCNILEEKTPQHQTTFCFILLFLAYRNENQRERKLR